MHIMMVLWTYALVVFVVNARRLRKSQVDALQIAVGENESVLGGLANVILQVLQCPGYGHMHCTSVYLVA